jgi:hypothetical protein
MKKRPPSKTPFQPQIPRLYDGAEVAVEVVPVKELADQIQIKVLFQ